MSSKSLTPIGSSTLDGSATLLSTLCLVHCLALPALSVFLPFASLLAEAEWIHQIFVLAAIPVTGLALMRPPYAPLFWAPAISGLVLLATGAFAEALHEVETPITVMGAVLLAGAHIGRWLRRR